MGELKLVVGVALGIAGVALMIESMFVFDVQGVMWGFILILIGMIIGLS